jgi:hypothetical protein
VIRRLPALTLVTAIAALGSAAAASAGTYTVRACHSDGINNSWSTYRSNGFADAYIQCAGGTINEGMVARNTGGPGLAPAFSNAQVYFDAPAGTRIVGVAGQARLQSDGGWDAGIRDVTMNRWVWCGNTCLSDFGQTLWFNIGGLGEDSDRVGALGRWSHGPGHWALVGKGLA